MPVLDLIDDTYAGCSPEILAPLVLDVSLVTELWPDWRVSVTESRGLEGVRWRVEGPVDGSAEIWIEPYRDAGAVLHVYVRVDPVGEAWSPRSVRRRTERLRRRIKAVMWRLADRAEGRA